jgi:hypothetical protein
MRNIEMMVLKCRYVNEKDEHRGIYESNFNRSQLGYETENYFFVLNISIASYFENLEHIESGGMNIPLQ